MILTILMILILYRSIRLRNGRSNCTNANRNPREGEVWYGLEWELHLEMDPRERCLADAADCEDEGGRAHVDVVFYCHLAHRPISLAHDLVKLLVDP